MSNNGPDDLQRYRLRSLGDFVNVRGNVVKLYGCSFHDLDEFLERIEYLRLSVANAADGLSFEELLRGDVLFAESAKVCLEMHGLSFKDVSLRLMQDLLLYEVVDEVVVPGLLVRLNTPRNSEQTEADTLRQLGKDPDELVRQKALALLANYTKSIAEAIDLSKKMTLLETQQLLEAAAKINQEMNSEAPTGSAGAANKYKNNADFAAKVEQYAQPDLATEMDDIIRQLG